MGILTHLIVSKNSQINRQADANTYPERKLNILFPVLFLVFVRRGSDGKAELVVLDHGLYERLETRFVLYQKCIVVCPV